MNSGKEKFTFLDGKSCNLGDLVISPRKNFINSSKFMQNHEKTEYHRFYEKSASDFIKNIENPCNDIGVIAKNFETVEMKRN